MVTEHQYRQVWQDSGTSCGYVLYAVPNKKKEKVLGARHYPRIPICPFLAVVVILKIIDGVCSSKLVL